MNVYINRPLFYKNPDSEKIFELLKNNLTLKDCNFISDRLYSNIDLEKNTIVLHRSYGIYNSNIKNIYIGNSQYECVNKILSLSDVIIILPSEEARNSEIYTIIINNKDIPLYILNIDNCFDGILNYLKKQNISRYKYTVVSTTEELLNLLDYLFQNQKVKKYS